MSQADREGLPPPELKKERPKPTFDLPQHVDLPPKELERAYQYDLELEQMMIRQQQRRMRSRREDIIDDSEAIKADNKLIQRAVKRHIVIPTDEVEEESDSEEDINGTDEATRARQ